jgi:mono/diheme cytochrome c family protein
MASHSPVPPSGNRRWFFILALLIVFAAGAAAIVYSGSGWHIPSTARNMKNPVAATEEAVDDGMFNYMKHCQSCHGQNGDGNGQRAESLSVKPADFTNAAMMHEHTDGELYWQITHGRPPMPGFQSKLNDTERWELVDYIRTLSQQPAATEPAAPAAGSPKESTPHKP